MAFISKDDDAWKADDTSNECYLCTREFRFFRRRHHCRVCGEIFCQDCSSTQLEDNRVCVLCHFKKRHDENVETSSKELKTRDDGPARNSNTTALQNTESDEPSTTTTPQPVIDLAAVNTACCNFFAGEFSPAEELIEKLPALQKQLEKLRKANVDTLRDATALKVCSAGAIICDGLSSLFEAAMPHNLVGKILGGVFKGFGAICGAGEKALINELECQILAQRILRLLPIVLQAALVMDGGGGGNNSNNGGGGGGMMSLLKEIDDALAMCARLVEEFVPPDDARDDGDENNKKEKADWKVRFSRWIAHKASYLVYSAKDFQDCHDRVDRIIRDVHFKATLDLTADIRGDMSRSVADITESCRRSLEHTFTKLDQMKHDIAQSVDEVTKRVVDTALATMRNSLEARLDSIEEKITADFKARLKTKEYEDLSLAPDRLQMIDLPNFDNQQGDDDGGGGGGGAMMVVKRGLLDGVLLVDVQLRRFSSSRKKETSAVATSTSSSSSPRDEANRVLREARLLRKLIGPGVVQCYGVGFLNHGKTCAVVMERCLCTVAALRPALATLDAERRTRIALYIAACVCSGLRVLLDCHVTHRAVNPNNIVMSNSDPPVAKLTNFASARRFDELRKTLSEFSTTAATATATQAMVDGQKAQIQAQYVAPEFYDADVPLSTAKGDVYSVGVTLFELVTCTKSNLDPAKGGRTWMRGRVDPGEDLRMISDGAVRSIVKRCLLERKKVKTTASHGGEAEQSGGASSLILLPRPEVGEVLRDIIQLRIENPAKYQMTRDDGCWLFDSAREKSSGSC